MMRPTLCLSLAPVVVACTALMSGCSATPQQPGQSVATESSYTSVGSYIPRKKSTTPGPDNVVNANLQNLENDRINGAGTMNLPSH